MARRLAQKLVAYGHTHEGPKFDVVTKNRAHDNLGPLTKHLSGIKAGAFARQSDAEMKRRRAARLLSLANDSEENSEDRNLRLLAQSSPQITKTKYLYEKLSNPR